MKALHVIAGLDPQHGGPSYSVPRLCAALEGHGCEAPIFTVGDTVERPGVQSFKQDQASLPLLGQLRRSNALRRALRSCAPSYDVLHAHGLWLMPNVYAGQAAGRAKRPLIVSPRGMLATEALAFSRHRKRIFWAVRQGPAYAKAAAWHATSPDEAAAIRLFGIKAPVFVIPNGVDIPAETAGHAPCSPTRQLIFLSRLHPKKNLPVLLHAWSRIAEQRLDWILTIAGPDEDGHREALEAQVRRMSVERVRFAGPVYGEEKKALLRTADLFVLPTLNENFGIAVAEALAAGIPAIVSRGAPWSGLVDRDCGWWVDQGVEPLVAALLEATSLPPADRRLMGVRGRAWMAQVYGWDALGLKMVKVYEWLRNGGAPPDTLA